MQKEKKQHDLTVGNPGEVLIKFTLPLLISAVFQQLYNIADSVIVGRFVGKNALAAVGASYPITMLFVAAALGLCTGAGVVIARNYGARDYGATKTAAFTSLLSAAVVSIVMTAVGFLLCNPLLRLMRTDESIFADSELYLKIYLLGVFFLFVYNICTGIFTALGDSVTPLVFLIISSLGNIGLDCLFVINFDMGVKGAAWATFLCQSICSVGAIIVLIPRLAAIKSDAPYKLYSWEMQKTINRISVPSILQQSFVSVGNLFIQSFVNGFGVNALAGYQSAVKINTFAVTVLVTMSNGVSSFTAQNLGAGKLDRVKKGFRSCLVIMGVSAVAMTLAFTIFAPWFTGLFLDAENAENTEALKIGEQFLHIVSPAFIIVGIKLTCDGVLKGGGAMREFMIDTFTDLLLRVGLSFVFAKFWRETGIWLSWPVGWLAAAIVSVYFYLRGSWRTASK